MDDFLDALRRLGEQKRRMPTINDAMDTIAGLEGDGTSQCVGVAQAQMPYCNQGHESDVVGVMIPSENVEARLRRGEFSANPGSPNPAFRGIFLPCFDLHTGVHNVYVLDIDAAMVLSNALGTAIRLMQERTDRLPPVGV